MLTAATLSALFAATGCGSRLTTGRQTGKPTGESSSTTTSSTTGGSTTGGSTTASSATPSSTSSSSPSTTAPSSTTTSTPTSPTGSRHCSAAGPHTSICVTEGRPLRRRRRNGLLLPLDDDEHDGQAGAEYASVASFEACHRAALDEIRHARSADALAGRSRSRFGAIPELLGRRIGGRWRSRRKELQRIATESFVDGWLNEGAAAERLRRRAEVAATPEERAVLAAMADDESGHAELAREIVLWCFDEDPEAVGRALAAVAA